MKYATVNGARVTATPGAKGSCPMCEAATIAKCGQVMTWHWAHRADSDCDPWGEESAWHLGWKDRVPAEQTEVVMERDGERHRADVVTALGQVVELQHSHLPVDQIHAREDFYGQMVWLYDARRWVDRIQIGRSGAGFWWKHGRKTMAHIRRPLFWDVGDEIWRVSIGVVDRYDGSEDIHGRMIPIGERVVGKLLSCGTHDSFIQWMNQQASAEQLQSTACPDPACLQPTIRTSINGHPVDVDPDPTPDGYITISGRKGAWLPHIDTCPARLSAKVAT